MLLKKACDLWETVGKTPIYQLTEISKLYSSNIFIKLESNNPTGSIKDRGGMFNILQRVLNNEITNDSILLEASSGNMASAVAYFGRRLGLKVKVVCSTKLTSDKALFIKSLGAELEYKGNLTIEGNKYCAEKSKNNDKYVFLDQLHTFNNPMGSFCTLGPEIIKQLPSVDIIIASVGSGGSLLGLSLFLNQVNKKIKFIPVHASSGSKIPGVGAFVDGDYITPFIEEANKKHLWENPIEISSNDALNAMREVQLNDGLFLGKQTGALIASIKFVKQRYGSDKNILIINGDAGWKNTKFIESVI